MRIGIDLGGTKTEALLIDKDGKKIFSKRIPTAKNYEGTIQGIVNLVEEIEQNHKEIQSIGIGMPGAISLETNLENSDLFLAFKALSKSFVMISISVG